MSLAKAYIIKPTSDERKENDYYPTSPFSTLSLHEMHTEGLPSTIYEPAAGRGWISKELLRLGYKVHSSDLIDYEDKLVDVITPNEDFLDRTKPFGANEGIVTNPPYKHNMPEKFFRHAMNLKCKFVAFCVRLTFLESKGRYKLFNDYSPSDIYVFSGRMNCDEEAFSADPHKQIGGMVAYAWVVWDYREGMWANTNVRWIDSDYYLNEWIKDNNV